jgi:hypothetical protein
MLCIDPHIDLDSGSEITEADVVAAVQAVLLQAESQEAAKKGKEQAEKDKQRQLETEMDMHNDTTSSHDEGGGGDSMNMNGGLGVEDAMSGLHSYGSSLRRPEPMEHILTEDGEPMLNPGLLLRVCCSVDTDVDFDPAELLTQASDTRRTCYASS